MASPNSLLTDVDLLFAAQGLAFLLLAAPSALVARLDRRLPWKWLALFALLRGLGEWVGIFTLHVGDTDWLFGVRLALLVAAYACLLEFGRASAMALDEKRRRLWLLLPAAIALAFALSNVAGPEAGIRWGMGLPAGLFAAAVLWQDAKRASRRRAGKIAFAAALAVEALTFSITGPPLLSPITILGGLLPWFQAAHLVAVGLLVVGMAHWHRGDEKSGMAPRQRGSGAVGLGLALFGVMVAGWSAVAWFGAREGGRKADQLLETAQLVAQALDRDDVAGVLGSAADEYLPEYRRLKIRLQVLRQNTPEVRLLYLMRQRDGAVWSLVDSEPKGSRNESPPGRAYEGVGDDLKAVFFGRNPRVGDPHASRFGNCVSVYVPLSTQRQGESPAVLGLDQDAALIQRSVRVERLRWIFLLLVLIGGYWQPGCSASAFFRPWRTRPPIGTNGRCVSGRGAWLCWEEPS
jgi:hypothetical protein